MAHDDVAHLRELMARRWERLAALDVVEAAEDIVRSHRRNQLLADLARAVRVHIGAEDDLTAALAAGNLVLVMAAEQRLCTARLQREAVAVVYTVTDDAYEQAGRHYQAVRATLRHSIRQLQLALNRTSGERH
ncbi:hypothetical protein Rhe02_33220 [Rhizocola hellebori]|uniref:Uncharacterized protein n=1 Tax=Rhizocola hellebori TaxID=1392758 RepID=A0A8J3Q8Z8_9ACTN|nr:hypothetical protein [Rhizocola hellebori]GIH05255.1 hypothetical protein Rhe02_33220 [Rhizocola hellebori]